MNTPFLKKGCTGSLECHYSEKQDAKLRLGNLVFTGEEHPVDFIVLSIIFIVGMDRVCGSGVGIGAAVTAPGHENRGAAGSKRCSARMVQSEELRLCH